MSVPSVTIAKDRLRNLLITDRIQCTPDMIEFLTSDLYQTISKYIESTENDNISFCNYFSSEFNIS